MKKWFLALAVVILPLLSIQTAQAFSVSPLKYEITVDPGTSELLKVTVGNSEATTQQFRLTSVPVTMDETDHPQYGVAGTEASSWLKFEPTQYTIGAKGKKEITITINPPAGIEPGTRVVAVVVQEVADNKGTVGLSPRIAIPLYITVAGKVSEALRISSWQPVQKVFSSLTWPIQLTLRNEGTVRVPLLGKVVVKNSQNEAVSEKIISLGNELFPNTNRSLSLTVIGEKTEPFLPARYTVNVLIQYGASKTVLNSTVVIWVVPVFWWIVGGVFILIIIGIILYKLFFKKRKFVSPV
jgi:hypothetical protein